MLSLMSGQIRHGQHHLRAGILRSRSHAGANTPFGGNGEDMWRGIRKAGEGDVYAS
jgi:hypothetical protein